MFFAAGVMDRKSQVKRLVLAAMNANVLAQQEVLEGKLSPERFQDVVKSIVGEVANKIMEINNGYFAKPSVN